MVLFVDGLFTVSLFDCIVPPKSLNGLHVLAWKDPPIFQLSAPKVEKQAYRRACGFQIVDDLRQLIIGELVTERLEFYDHLLFRK